MFVRFERLIGAENVGSKEHVFLSPSKADHSGNLSDMPRSADSPSLPSSRCSWSRSTTLYSYSTSSGSNGRPKTSRKPLKQNQQQRDECSTGNYVFFSDTGTGLGRRDENAGTPDALIKGSAYAHNLDPEDCLIPEVSLSPRTATYHRLAGQH